MNRAYDGGMESYWAAVVWSLLPTLVVSALFFFVLRGILRMDRTERRVYSRHRGARSGRSAACRPSPTTPRPDAAPAARGARRACRAVPLRWVR